MVGWTWSGLKLTAVGSQTTSKTAECAPLSLKKQFALMMPHSVKKYLRMHAQASTRWDRIRPVCFQKAPQVSRFGQWALRKQLPPQTQCREGPTTSYKSWFGVGYASNHWSSLENTQFNSQLRSTLRQCILIVIASFEIKYVGFIGTYTLVLHNVIICTYFTVELKPDVDANEIAENKIAAAGAVALYNRFQIFVQATGRLTPELRDRKFRSAKHYGLKLRAHRYEIYRITPKRHDYAW